jgi:thiol:disulfide interchange protein DsbD
VSHMVPRFSALLCTVVAGLLVSGELVRAQARRPRAEITSLVESAAAHAGGPVRLALKVALPEGLHTQSNLPRDPTLIPTTLTIDAPAGVRIDEIVFPHATDLKQAGLDQPLAVFEREFAIGVQATLASSVAGGELSIPAHLRYQACDVNLCYPPSTADLQWTVAVVPASKTIDSPGDPIFQQIAFGHGQSPAAPPAPAAAAGPALAGETGVAQLDDFTVLGTTGYSTAADFVTFIHNAERGVKERGMFEGRGPLAILLIVLIGGFALNLTPCVLPMIPINLAIIGAGAQAGSRGRGFLLGSAYGGAMAIVYGVLGLVVILTAGTFGTINASPWFNVGIAVLFVVLSLAMFDLIVIDFSSLGSGFRVNERSRGSVLLALSMGAIAALLAGACVAPVVIQVVLFSSNLYATGTPLALALPFCLGIGMAAPWPVAGAGLASLPKPGLWMVRVKYAFGVLILVTAAYYGYVAYDLLSSRWVDPAAVASSVEAQLQDGWTRSLAAGLAAARREHKPVLIDMWATWCKNCLVMDRTTLANADVRSALAGYVKIKYQAEQPDASPAKDVMKRFDAVGLPTYVILRPIAGR